MEEIIHDLHLLLYLRLINIVLITLAGAAWFIFYKRYKMIMAFAPMTWLIHVLIYGIYRFIYTPSAFYVTEKNEVLMDVWTALIIMHGLILLLVAAIESIPPIKYCEKKEDQ
jgi:hypothetical protein